MRSCALRRGTHVLLVFWHVATSLALSHSSSKHSLPGCGNAPHRVLAEAETLQQKASAGGGGGGGCAAAAPSSSQPSVALRPRPRCRRRRPSWQQPFAPRPRCSAVAMAPDHKDTGPRRSSFSHHYSPGFGGRQAAPRHHGGRRRCDAAPQRGAELRWHAQHDDG
eukprot:COSAG06_NODE_5411_length_3500_cov_2.009409_3_plen_165_part_00